VYSAVKGDLFKTPKAKTASVASSSYTTSDADVVNRGFEDYMSRLAKTSPTYVLRNRKTLKPSFRQYVSRNL
jgi:hypothetical protein